MDNKWIKYTDKDGQKDQFIKTTHEVEKHHIEDITKKAFKNVESRETPTIDVLPSVVKDLINKRFPKTNDDTLHDDMAQKFITDSNYLDTLQANDLKDQKIEQEIKEGVFNIYKQKMDFKECLEIYIDLNKKVSYLLTKLAKYELQFLHQNKSPLPNQTLNKESLHLLKKAIESIKKELDTIKDEDISSESVGQILNNYRKFSKKYETVMVLLDPDNPSLN